MVVVLLAVVIVLLIFLIIAYLFYALMAFFHIIMDDNQRLKMQIRLLENQREQYLKEKKQDRLTINYLKDKLENETQTLAEKVN